MHLNRHIPLSLLLAGTLATTLLPVQALETKTTKATTIALDQLSQSPQQCGFSQEVKLYNFWTRATTTTYALAQLNEGTLTIRQSSSIRLTYDARWEHTNSTYEIAIPLAQVSRVQIPKLQPQALQIVRKKGATPFIKTLTEQTTSSSENPTGKHDTNKVPSAIEEVWLMNFRDTKTTQNAKKALEALVKAAKDKQ